MKFSYETAHTLSQVDTEKLNASGKRFIIVDLDNTIARWRTDIIKPEAREWIKAALDEKLDICILSNNHNKQRTQDIADMLGVKRFSPSKKKPSKKAYLETLEYMGGNIENAVMIGDQLFSDIRGAHKAGIDGILVDPIFRKEAFVTKILRICERIAGRKIIWQDK